MSGNNCFHCQCRLWTEEDEEEIQKLKKQNEQYFKIISELSEVRIYNSCNVFRGVMIRDNEKAYQLVKRAKQAIKQVEEL